MANAQGSLQRALSGIDKASGKSYPKDTNVFAART